MARNAWRVWGISVAMASSLAAADKPAELPARTEIQGRSTPVVTEEYFQVEAGPAPRLLPAQILDGQPSKTTPPTANPYLRVIGVQVPGLDTSDLDIPIRVDAWKARAAFEVAEMYFRSCDTVEARLWYHEVVKLAPKSDYATMAAERLQQTEVVPAGAVESREPPLADAPPAESIVRIR